MGTNEILASFGKPSWVETLAATNIEWGYRTPEFSADDGMRGSYMIGVILRITNGFLARWTCTYMDQDVVSRKEGLVSSNGTTPASPLDNAPVLKLFVVSLEPIAKGGFVDTARFPKLGYISATPAMTIDKLKAVTVDARPHTEAAGNSFTNWEFSIYLMPEDSKRFKSLTTENLSKTLLTIINDESISASKIMEPIASGVFILGCSDADIVEMLKSQFKIMVAK